MDDALLEHWEKIRNIETGEGGVVIEGVKEKFVVSQKPMTPDLFDALFPRNGGSVNGH